VGVSALRYPSGQADPLDIGGQVSTSSATGIVVAEIHAEREQSPGSGDGSATTSRQPSAIAAAARLPPEGPSHVLTMLSVYMDGKVSMVFNRNCFPNMKDFLRLGALLAVTYTVKVAV